MVIGGIAAHTRIGGIGWEAAMPLDASRPGGQCPRGTDPGVNGHRDDTGQPSSVQAAVLEQRLTDAAQTVAQLQSLVAGNPDLVDDLEDGLVAARSKLDQAVVDLVECGLHARGTESNSYADHRTGVLGIGAECAARHAGDPVALAAFARATRTMRSQEYLREQVDIASVDLVAYTALQAARGQPADPRIVAGKEAAIARFEALVAGAEAAQATDPQPMPGPQDAGFFYRAEAAHAPDVQSAPGKTTETHTGRVGTVPTAAAD